MQSSTSTSIGGFSKIQTLVGSSAATDTLIGPNTTNAWQITGKNAGKVGTLGFTGIEDLVGGTGVDTFAFTSTGSVASINGGGAPTGQGDWLDYSSFAAKNPIAVNLATGSATGVNGGAAGSVSGIQNVTGGAGNDSLTGNAQGNILLGGGGNDTISGGSGRSLLIGDAGSDTITGGADDDILVSGTTSYDANHAALMALLQEWQRTDETYAQRITDLKSGTGLSKPFKLASGSTVKSDTNADKLTGGAGLDWFFANLGSGGSFDMITDRNTGGSETVN